MRYMLFEGKLYYPCGGWKDFAGFFDTIPEALASLKELQPPGGWEEEYGWHHIVDVRASEIIEEE